ncbi:Dyggve-Melchior-Clausen syndrome protein-domain-containing protein [Spinellus fusiger]|nr:Dyggve-Melchior-Clausen syndrome protein-domain-containing protein [Spinellus fusiger]
MNPHQSPPLGQPSLPALTVPDKTLSSLSTTATASTTATGKRPPHSTATTTAAAPLHSPSLEVSDSFSTTGYSPTKPFLGHTLLRKSSESPFFTAIQTTALRNLCSSTAHPPSAPLWHTLLDSHKFTAPHSVQDISDLEMATVGLAIELAANNVTTHNFNALLLHLLSQLHRWQAAKLENVPASTLKALFLTRVFAKHFAGNLTNEQMIAQFEATEIPSAAVTESAESAEGGGKPLKTPTAGSSLSLDLQKLVIHPEVQLDTRPKGEQLLDHALSILITTDPSGNDSLYEFYVEVLNTLLVLFSTQFHHTHLGEGNYFLDILFQHFSHTSEAVIAKLLDNFIQQTSPPAQSSSKCTINESTLYQHSSFFLPFFIPRSQCLFLFPFLSFFLK